MRQKAENLPALEQLAAWFHARGSVRRQNAERLAAEGYGRYKKGDEIRLAAGSKAELARVRKLLREAGFRPGKPFAKRRSFCQPLYGRQEVRRFLDLIGADDDT